MKYNIQEIVKRHKKGEDLEYLFFYNHQIKKDWVDPGCLNQGYPSIIHDDGIKFNTAEHFMMSEKANIFGDEEIWDKIIKSNDPDEVKDLGRKIKNFDSGIWDIEKYDIVKKGNLLKFSQNECLKKFLLSTNNQILVYCTISDLIWGVGPIKFNINKGTKGIKPHNWNGENLLGFALMEVRDILKENLVD